MRVEEVAALWNFGEPAQSEERFRQALEMKQEDAIRVELMTQTARALGLQRRFEDAHVLLDEAGVAPGANEDRPVIFLALERGRLFNSVGNRVDAVPLFEQALELATHAAEEALAIDAAHMLGIASPPDEQLAWNERALTIAEAATDDRSRNWIGSLLNNIGWTYHDRGDFEKALDRFERAATWRRGKGQPNETRIADWAVARTLRSLGRLDDALAIQNRLKSEWEAAGESDPYVDEELAECLVGLGRIAEAKPYFWQAYEGLSTEGWLMANEPARIARLRDLGTVTG